MHLVWAARNTLVLEFQVDIKVNYAMWELSPLLEQNCEYKPTTYQGRVHHIVKVNKES